MEYDSASCQPDLKEKKSNKKKRCYAVKNEDRKPASRDKKVSCYDSSSSDSASCQPDLKEKKRNKKKRCYAVKNEDRKPASREKKVSCYDSSSSDSASCQPDLKEKKSNKNKRCYAVKNEDRKPASREKKVSCYDSSSSDSASCQPDLKEKKSNKNKRCYAVKNEDRKPASREKKVSCYDSSSSDSASCQPDLKEKKSNKKKKCYAVKNEDRKPASREKKVSSYDSSSSEEFTVDDICTLDEYKFKTCSCCNDCFGGKMYKCCECHRKYHDYCHIPKIVPRRENRKKMWRCTLCEDMNTISKDLGEDGDPENISVGTVGRKIAERILMELYCYIDGSDIFRERPNKKVFPEYYKIILRPAALNDVRDFMISNTNYTLSEMIEDIKQVFVNAMFFYEIGDPYLNLARRLLTHLHILYQTWIVLPTKKKQWTVVTSE